MPNIGKVASGTAATPFTVDATAGGVTIGSGGAQFIPYSATRTSQTTITINCTGGKKCGQNNVTVTITSGSTNGGRLGAITAWEADFTGTSTAALTSGQTNQSCTCSSIVLTLKPIGATSNSTSGSKTFFLGMTAPVNTTGTLGSGTASYSVTASGTGFTQGSGSAAMQSTVEGKLGISKSSDLAYGTIVLIAGQSGTMTWDAANQTLSTSPAAGLIVQKGSSSIAHFLVTGTPTQTLGFTLTNNAGLPNAIRVTNGSGQTLDITLSTTAQSSQTIPISGTFDIYVGGTINISPTMHTGAYTGTFTITANYQ